MSAQDDVNAFLQAQGAKAFPFENVGDSVTGVIIQMELRQQTDINTGEPQSWPDGRPKMMTTFQLQTELQDDEADDGVRSVFLRGGNFTPANGKGTSSLTALRDALKAAGASQVEVGGTLTLAYTGNGQQSNRAFTAPKLYSCRYVPPVAAIAADDLF